MLLCADLFPVARGFHDFGLWIGGSNIGSIQRNSKNLNFSAL